MQNNAVYKLGVKELIKKYRADPYVKENNMEDGMWNNNKLAGEETYYPLEIEGLEGISMVKRGKKNQVPSTYYLNSDKSIVMKTKRVCAEYLRYYFSSPNIKEKLSSDVSYI